MGRLPPTTNKRSQGSQDEFSYLVWIQHNRNINMPKTATNYQLQIQHVGNNNNPKTTPLLDMEQTYPKKYWTTSQHSMASREN